MAFCKRPLNLSSEDNPYKLVRCGQCLPCRIQRRREKVGVQCLEEKLSGGAVFITLTYDDDHINLTAGGVETLYRRDLTSFLAKLRYRLKKHYGLPCKFLAVGEYGEQTHRPHLHLNAFGPAAILHTDHFEKLVTKIWPHGFIKYMPVDEAGSFDYVAGYTLKKLTTPRTNRGAEPEFFAQSQNQNALGYGAVPMIANRIALAINPETIEIGQHLITGENITSPKQARQVLADKGLDYRKTTRLQMSAALHLSAYIAGDIRINGKVYPMPRRFREQVESQLGLDPKTAKIIYRSKARLLAEEAQAENTRNQKGSESLLSDFEISEYQSEKSIRGLEIQQRKTWAKKKRTAKVPENRLVS